MRVKVAYYEALIPDIPNGFGIGELCENVDFGSQSFHRVHHGVAGHAWRSPPPRWVTFALNCINVRLGIAQTPEIPAQNPERPPTFPPPKAFFLVERGER